MKTIFSLSVLLYTTHIYTHVVNPNIKSIWKCNFTSTNMKHICNELQRVWCTSGQRNRIIMISTNALIICNCVILHKPSVYSFQYLLNMMWRMYEISCSMILLLMDWKQKCIFSVKNLLMDDCFYFISVKMYFNFKEKSLK